MSVAAIIQARMGSTRLPGKVLEDLGGRCVLGWVTRAAASVAGVDIVAVATSVAGQDDSIADWCADNGFRCERGPEDDVLARYAAAARAVDATTIMRLTGDTPFLDPAVCAQVLYLHRRSNADYTSNVDPARWPDGLDCEVFSADALFTAEMLAFRPSDREHVTPYIRHNRPRFAVASLPCPIPGLDEERWALDTPEDLDFLRSVAGGLRSEESPAYIEILRILDAEPHLRTINSGQTKSFDTSTQLLKRTERIIPLASQTFSKSRVQYPVGAAPLFLTHGDGGRVWDVDGNEFVDMVGGLLCLTLGYRDPDVDRAIAEQLDAGISFSLATERERELAERLIELIPCAEMARFGKNGSDATSAAIRIARAATGRDRIAACGYHGWHDWYIGSTSRNKGVPAAVSALTHSVPYDDLDAVDRLFREYPDSFAALILEPVNVVEPAPGYLGELRELVHTHGALLVFDEIITGFRLDLGGAQAMFGVTPDLACVGKGMANGMPISAIVGRAELMAEMENIFFSGTFGGEALSLAASIAVIDKMRREPVIETLWRNGEQLGRSVDSLIIGHGLEDVIQLRGWAPWKLLSFTDHANGSAQAVKTMLIYELAARGVLSLGSHNMCYAHTPEDLERTKAAYAGVFGAIRDALDSGNLDKTLKVPVIEPVFQVR